jgi:hypothetical protein
LTCLLRLNSFIPDTSSEEGRKLLERYTNSISEEQFDLSYYIPGMTYRDTEEMAIFERKEFYGRLLKRKMEEKERAEEAAKTTSGKVSSSPRKRNVRRR